MGRDGIRIYLNQLAWYDAELQKDDYVLGCAVFTAGPMNHHWVSYDITPILRHIATYIIVPGSRSAAQRSARGCSDEPAFSHTIASRLVRARKGMSAQGIPFRHDHLLAPGYSPATGR